jgi:hypothetical protein
MRMCCPCFVYPSHELYLLCVHINEHFIWVLIHLDTTSQTDMLVNTVVPLLAAEWLVTLLGNREFASTNLGVNFV